MGKGGQPVADDGGRSASQGCHCRRQRPTQRLPPSSSTPTRTFRGIHDSTSPLPPHGWSLACFHHPRRLRPIADMSAEKKITVRASSATTPKTKSPPEASAIPVPFVYHPSDDGTDENLLILLHGLGEQSARPSPSMDSLIFTPQATPRSLSESWGASFTCPRPLHLHCEHRNSMYFPFAWDPS